MGINFPWGQTGRRRTRAPLSHSGGGCGAGGDRGERGEGGAHIVSIYHSHVTKFSPHRETLLTSTEHVAFVDIMYIIAAFPAFRGKLYWLYFQQSMSKYLIKSFDSFYYGDF